MGCTGERRRPPTPTRTTHRSAGILWPPSWVNWFIGDALDGSSSLKASATARRRKRANARRRRQWVRTCGFPRGGARICKRPQRCPSSSLRHLRSCCIHRTSTDHLWHRSPVWGDAGRTHSCLVPISSSLPPSVLPPTRCDAGARLQTSKTHRFHATCLRSGSNSGNACKAACVQHACAIPAPSNMPATYSYLQHASIWEQWWQSLYLRNRGAYYPFLYSHVTLTLR